MLSAEEAECHQFVPRSDGGGGGGGGGGDELKSHPFSVHFFDLILSKKTDLCAEIWNN